MRPANVVSGMRPSPAVEAKRMLDDILDYYCKDMYNP